MEQATPQSLSYSSSTNEKTHATQRSVHGVLCCQKLVYYNMSGQRSWPKKILKTKVTRFIVPLFRISF